MLSICFLNVRLLFAFFFTVIIVRYCLIVKIIVK